MLKTTETEGRPVIISPEEEGVTEITAPSRLKPEAKEAPGAATVGPFQGC